MESDQENGALCWKTKSHFISSRLRSKFIVFSNRVNLSQGNFIGLMNGNLGLPSKLIVEDDFDMLDIINPQHRALKLSKTIRARCLTQYEGREFEQRKNYDLEVVRLADILQN